MPVKRRHSTARPKPDAVSMQLTAAEREQLGEVFADRPLSLESATLRSSHPASGAHRLYLSLAADTKSTLDDPTVVARAAEAAAAAIGYDERGVTPDTPVLVADDDTEHGHAYTRGFTVQGRVPDDAIAREEDV